MHSLNRRLSHTGQFIRNVIFFMQLGHRLGNAIRLAKNTL